MSEAKAIKMKGTYVVPIKFKPVLRVERDVPPQDEFLTIYNAALHSLIKRQAVNVVTGHTVDFDSECWDLLLAIKEHYYSKGLRHMDTMHGIVDNAQDFKQQ